MMRLVLVWVSVLCRCCFVLVCLLCVVLLFCCCCVWWVCSGPLRRTPSAEPPKISLFFPFPATIFILFSLSCWSFSLNFGSVFEGRNPQMCTFGVLGLSCASPGGPVWLGRWGFVSVRVFFECCFSCLSLGTCVAHSHLHIKP